MSEPKLEPGRASFLRTELELAFTFSTIAATKYDAGNAASAELSIANAEKAYETVDRYLSDPKYSQYLTLEEVNDLTSELRRLRDKLAGIAQRFKK